MTNTDAITDMPEQPASTERLHAAIDRLSAHQELERAQGKLDRLNLSRALLETEAATKQAEAATLADPDAVDVRLIEAAHNQLRARGMARAAEVAELEANAAQLGFVEADEYARALGVPAWPNAN